MRARILAGLIVSVGLAAAPASASAQADSHLSVAAGLSVIHTNETGIGGTGQFAESLKTSPTLSTSLVEEVSWLHFGGHHFSLLLIGAGPRFWLAAHGKITPYVEAMAGLVHRSNQDGGVRTDWGVAPGIGVRYAASPSLDLIIGADLGIVAESKGASKGIRIFVGVTKPIGGR